jgi:hypothetical protein
MIARGKLEVILGVLAPQLAGRPSGPGRYERDSFGRPTVAPKMCLHVSQNPSEWPHALVPESATRGNSFG